MTSVGFKPAIPAVKRLSNYASDLTLAGVGIFTYMLIKFLRSLFNDISSKSVKR